MKTYIRHCSQLHKRNLDFASLCNDAVIAREVVAIAEKDHRALGSIGSLFEESISESEDVVRLPLQHSLISGVPR